MRVVALLAEGVDRNWLAVQVGGVICVALLAEGVDRNNGHDSAGAKLAAVALLAEGVDRNWLAVQVGGVICCRPPRGGRG